MSNWDFRTL